MATTFKRVVYLSTTYIIVDVDGTQSVYTLQGTRRGSEVLDPILKANVIATSETPTVRPLVVEELMGHPTNYKQLYIDVDTGKPYTLQ